MAYVPRYVIIDGKRKRDPKRTFTDTETGEVVSRYQQLKSHYGGITPEQHARIQSGEYLQNGETSPLYDRAFRQWRRHNPDADIEEWDRVADDLFAHYQSGKDAHKRAWERRMQALIELWYEYGEELDPREFRDYVSPEQGGK